MNYETEVINGYECVVRHIFKGEELEVGSRWCSADGSKSFVIIDEIKSYPLVDSSKMWYEVYYSREIGGKKFTHNKNHFAFQCRYCLIV